MKKRSPIFWVDYQKISKLWVVWQTGITHSTAVDGFEEKELAETYCSYLNKIYEFNKNKFRNNNLSEL